MAATDAKEREYSGYRQAAYETSVADMSALALYGTLMPPIIVGRLRITAIDDVALSALYRQWGTPRFPWNRICGQSRPYVKRFEAAIWIDNDLEGLCDGRPSHGDDNLTLRFLERRPSPSLLKGYLAEIAFDAAEAYASILGKQRLKLKDPVAGAIPLYEALGFTFAETRHGIVYYERGVP